MNGQKPIPFAHFMEEALYGENGYYTKGVNFLQSPPRDFTTAPELTPLFGATLAKWVAKQWQTLGQPNAFTLCEMGPGRGSLMHPLLTHLRDAHPSCFTALHQVQLIELSPILTQIQQQTLAPWGNLCTWFTTLPTVNRQHPTLLIANEVLDALPAQPYRYQNGGWEMLYVHKNNPIWHPTAAPPLPAGWHPTEGAHYEHLPALKELLEIIKPFADAALLIDYGAQTLPPQGAETLQAMQHHKPVSLFHEPNNTDLTTHINFGHVADILGKDACTLTPLADFLLAHGLHHIALTLLPHPATESALHRLLHPNHMGTLHLTLCYTRSTLIAKSPAAS